MATENRPAYTAGLRAVADFLDQHPEVPLPYLGSLAEGSALPALPIYLTDRATARADLAAIARAMGNAVKAPKDYLDGESRIHVWREFEGVVLVAQAPREEVCTRVVTGTEDREVEEVVTPAVTRKVVKSVEVVEWKCEPLLAVPVSIDEAIDLALDGDAEGVTVAVGRALAEPEPGVEACLDCGATDTPMRDGRCNERVRCAARRAERLAAI